MNYFPAWSENHEELRRPEEASFEGFQQYQNYSLNQTIDSRSEQIRRYQQELAELSVLDTKQREERMRLQQKQREERRELQKRLESKQLEERMELEEKHLEERMKLETNLLSRQQKNLIDQESQDKQPKINNPNHIDLEKINEQLLKEIKAPQRKKYFQIVKRIRLKNIIFGMKKR